MTRKNKRKIKKNKSKKNRTRNRLAKGLSPISPTGSVLCCMCNKEFPRNTMLTPQVCLNEYGERAHKICQKCWFNKFAIEGISHPCPGCEKGFPLTRPLKPLKKTKHPIKMVDLTLDSSSSTPSPPKKRQQIEVIEISS